MPNRPRSWANFSLLWLCSHKNAWAKWHILGQPCAFLARRLTVGRRRRLGYAGVVSDTRVRRRARPWFPDQSLVVTSNLFCLSRKLEGAELRKRTPGPEEQPGAAGAGRGRGGGRGGRGRAQSHRRFMPTPDCLYSEAAIRPVPRAWRPRSPLCSSTWTRRCFSSAVQYILSSSIIKPSIQ